MSNSVFLFDTGAIYLPPLVSIVIDHGCYTVSLDTFIANNTAKLVWYDADADREQRKRMYNIPCFCKNIMQGHEIITNKHDLHHIVALQSHLAASWSLGDKPCAPYPWIIKPSDGFSGEGVEIVSNPTEFDHKLATAKLKAAKKSRTHEAGKIIVCAYINNPLLFKGLKFHLRLFLLVGLYDGKFISGVCPVGRLMTAAAPYDPKNFSKLVADTHLKSTTENLTLADITTANCGIPQSQIDKLIADAKAYCEIVAKQCEGKIRPYPESTHAFHIMGADILLTPDNFYLLEVNENPGFGEKFSHLWEWKLFNYEFFQWLEKTYLGQVLDS
jgi:hypothetical protein